MVYKVPTIYKMGSDELDLKIESYNFVPLQKYASKFDLDQPPYLKTANNGIVQLCSSISCISQFTPYYEPTDGEHSSINWPLLGYFENVENLKNNTYNTSIVFDYLGRIYPIGLHIWATDKKVYLCWNRPNAVPQEYLNLIGCFLG